MAVSMPEILPLRALIHPLHVGDFGFLILDGPGHDLKLPIPSDFFLPHPGANDLSC